MIIFRLSKAGYGSVKEIRDEWDAREVIQAIHYEKFIDDYERAYLEMRTQD